MCVGNNFAMYEMVLTVAELIRKYKISTSQEAIALDPLISLKPEEVLLTFAKR